MGMRFNNPAQAIHDAYAINMRGKDLQGGGGAPMDSSTRAFNQVKAGLVIKAVESQPAPYSLILKCCFTPPGIMLDSEASLLMIHTLTDYLKQVKAKKKYSERKISELTVLTIKALSSFPVEVQGGRSIFTRNEIASSLGRTNVSTDITTHFGAIQNILQGYLDIALGPVYEVCEKQYEMIKDSRLESLQRRIRDLKANTQLCVRYVNQNCGTAHSTLNTLSYYEADVLENQLDAIEQAQKSAEEAKKGEGILKTA